MMISKILKHVSDIVNVIKPSACVCRNICVAVCVSVVLHAAFSLNHYSFGEICDFFIVFLPDELRALIHLAGFE